MLMWHGLADQLVPINGSRQYYDISSAIDPNITDYFRYFEVPGVNHCRSGPGPYPGGILDALMTWVEDKAPPATLNAISLPDKSGQSYERELCQYPLVQKYSGEGDIRKASSYTCISE